jgi:hypothetical protein
VLSQNVFHHQKNVRQRNRALFNKTGHHLQMENHRFIKNLQGRDLILAFTAGVNSLLLFFPLGSLIIFTTSFCAVFFTVGLATAKRTINVIARGIAGMGQKDNPAVSASFQAGAKISLFPYY